MSNFARPLLIVACAFLSVGFQAPPDSGKAAFAAGKQIISGAEIRQLGVRRLADLVDLAGGWSSFAIDDWQRTARPPGVAPFQTRTWQVWIDGQRIPKGLAPSSLNQLPVAVDDVARVEVIQGPAWHRGVFVPYGALHLHTRSPERGASLHASYWTGNEIGDPGPLEYTGYATPNVDHHGPDVAVVGRYGASDAFGKALGVSRIHYPTNPAQIRRIEAWSPYFPRRQLWGGALQVQIESQRGAHRVQGGGSTVHDFVFWEAAAREIPLRRTQGYAGAGGQRVLAQKHQIAYRATYGEERLTEVDGTPFGTPSSTVARAQQFDAQGRWMYAGAATRATLTGGLQLHAMLGHTVRRLKLGARVQRDVGGTRSLGAGTVSLEEGTAYLDGLASLRRPFGEQLSLAVKVAWTERPFRTQRPLAYARRYGFSLLDSISVFTGALQKQAERTFHVEAGAAWNPLPTLRFGGRLFWRRQRGGVMFYRQRLTYDAGERAFSGPLRLRAGSGGMAGAQVRARWRWKRLRQTTSALVQGPTTGGNAAYRAAWRAAPRWQIGSRWRWIVTPRFLLAAQLRGQAGGTWANYEGAGALSGGAYEAGTPASWRIDLSAQKRFWGEHLRVGLMLRNALNRPVQTHPLGAESVMMFVVEASLRL